eukprot:Opistho-2@79654
METKTEDLPPVVDFETVKFETPFNKYMARDISPVPLREVVMNQYSAAVRDKPNWEQKLKDPAIVAKWNAEARTQGVSKKMAKYIIAELEYYASIKDGPMQVSGIDGTWQADGLVPEALKNELLANVTVLEDVPKDLQDWHPGSDKQVLDLVHPSLYPYVRGVSRKTTVDANPPLAWIGAGAPEPVGTRRTVDTNKRYDPDYGDYYTRSDTYQWLPSEFDIGLDGKVKIASYINNLHPYYHKDLYGTLGRVFERFVPMFNKVLTDMINPRERRLHADAYAWYDKGADSDVYSDEDKPDKNKKTNQDDDGISGDGGSEEDEEDGDGDEDDDEDYDENRIPKEPSVPEFERPPAPAEVVDLRGRRVQVIVKLANIVLTPEKPDYSGGVWHVEGMENENIVASGIYYYKSENISESRLAFRTEVNEPNYEQGDARGVSAIYGLEGDDSPLNQVLGSLLTMEDRCIAFPNTLQHRVEPFSLIDRTKSGVRKILVFFLVDPTERILSTLNVPCQQRDWIVNPIRLTGGLIRDLPMEIFEKIMSYVDWPMSQEEALKHRALLMKERKYFVKMHTTEIYERAFSLCEH